MSRLITIIFFAACVSVSALAQDMTSGDKAKLLRADLQFTNENYDDALPMYEELAKAYPTNVKSNYRAGICHFYTAYKLRSLSYMLAAEKNWGTDTISEVYYYLGAGYQMQNNFEKAIFYYSKLKSTIKADKFGNKGAADVDRYIDQCNLGKEYFKKPTPVRLTNAGPSINTKDPEYAPVISADESKIIFTSKRESGTGKSKAPDGYYYEDIYIADRLNQGWQAAAGLGASETSKKKPWFYIFYDRAKSIGDAINSKDHDASISLSPDGKKLFIYRSSQIYMSEFDGTKWGKPVKLNDNINEKRSYQPSCSMTADEKLLYIISDREGGYGGKDIYVSNKQSDGSWGPCVNLGEDINTDLDEDGPFITPDGKSLYFSSQGHEGIGGYDVYRSDMLGDGKWSKPENLGYPTNTGADDIFFVMNAKQTRAYLASIKEDTYGDYDIYALSYLPVTNLYAVVKDGATMSPAGVTVKVRGTKDVSDTATYATTAGTGRYQMYLLAPDNYKITANMEGYKSHTSDVSLPDQFYKKPFYQQITFETHKDANGKALEQITTYYNAFFDIDSVVNADPSLVMLSKQDAYFALVNKLDTKTTKLNFKVQSFVDDLREPAIVATNTVTTTGTTGTTMGTTTGTTTGITTGTTTSTTTAGTENIKQFPPILFDYSKSLLRDEIKPELEEIVAYLNANKDLKLVIEGHTDSKGTEAFNYNLSAKRALVTADYFAGMGISRSRLKSSGKGEKFPILPNVNPDDTDNPDGRQKNRRVEFKIVSIVNKKTN